MCYTQITHAIPEWYVIVDHIRSLFLTNISATAGPTAALFSQRLSKPPFEKGLRQSSGERSSEPGGRRQIFFAFSFICLRFLIEISKKN